MGKSSSGKKLGSSVVSFEQARKIAEKQGTPTLVCDLKKVEENYRKLASVMPDIQPYYAVKANPLPEILKTLERLGSSFDIASKNEIIMCLDAGATPERMIYSNPVKSVEYIKFAYDNGVKTFTFDNPVELEKMAKYAPGSNVVLRLAVRDLGSVCKFSTKFGAKEKFAVELLRKAKNLGLNPQGLAFHVGSQCTNIDNFSSALEMCSRVFRNATKNGITLSLVDIGGGIPVRYLEDVYSIDDVATLINARAKELFPEGIRFISEPGRFIVANCMTLITRVIGVNDLNGTRRLYIDDGCYNSLSENVFGHCNYELLTDKSGETQAYMVFGPTCDSMDIVAKDYHLPEMGAGDLLLIPNTGAYTNTAATHFNGFDPARILFL